MIPFALGLGAVYAGYVLLRRSAPPDAATREVERADKTVPAEASTAAIIFNGYMPAIGGPPNVEGTPLQPIEHETFVPIGATWGDQLTGEPYYPVEVV